MAIIPMDEEILPVYDDRIFKATLTHPDAKPALIDLISAVIERKVLDVSIRGNEPPTMDVEEKNERLDINCVIDDGSQVDVEIQGSRLEISEGDHRNFINKSIYYLADLHSSQKSKGIKYSELVQTYQITFIAYTVFPKRWGFVNKFNLCRYPNGKPISDQLNLIIIELSKLREVLKKPARDMTAIEAWSAFIAYADDPKKRKVINEILEQREAMAMASSVLREISKDEHERARLRSRRMFETDMTSDLLTAEARGEIKERKKWKLVITKKDAMIAEKEAVITEKEAVITEKDVVITEKDAVITEKDAMIAELQARLNKYE